MSAETAQPTILEMLAPPKGTPPDYAQQVFDHWRRVMDSPRSQFDDKRRRPIEKQLKGRTVVDLCRAIDGCARSDWHMGKDPKTAGKKYNGIALICESAENIEKFMALADQPGSGTAQVSRRAQLAKSQTADLLEALRNPKAAGAANE